ncbi:hypothetical protein DEO72_LG2g4287 [Vigna unguiculata]|uniref:Uncharacterized protein n=1 Tax=Vigna unguiculata TaxID=3917 RepID=A0A4D6L616_VIGUN|nr:hypothetical protein DEO72_LG2g4287 [Vigna unguiculata]
MSATQCCCNTHRLARVTYRQALPLPDCLVGNTYRQAPSALEPTDLQLSPDEKLSATRHHA